MPYKDPVIAKIKQKERNRKSYINNIDKVRKRTTISNWIKRGVIETDQYTYDELYEAYLYHPDCEFCGVTLTMGDRYNTPTSKSLDHDHETGVFRNILCHSCNIKRR